MKVALFLYEYICVQIWFPYETLVIEKCFIYDSLKFMYDMSYYDLY